MALGRPFEALPLPTPPIPLIDPPSGAGKPATRHSRVHFERFQWLAAPFPSHCNSQPPRPEERQRRVSKDAPMRTDVAESWSIVRDAAFPRGSLSHEVRGGTTVSKPHLGSYEPFPVLDA